MAHTGLKIGDLARRTGLTVRTLHHYDRTGLLRPSARTGSGHRLYSGRDVQRLQRIVSLKQLGLSLADIAHSLNPPGFSARQILARHLGQLRTRIALEQNLCRRMEKLLDQMKS